MTDHDKVRRLAQLLQQRNAIEHEISSIIDRPSHSGHLGEFVAAKIFDIDLFKSATHKGADGRFTRGALAGKSVNVKKYSKDEGLLDINRDALPDYYLVLTGPKSQPTTSRGTVQPWVIESVYLFGAHELVAQLKVKIGTATSVRRYLWDEARIYPSTRNATLQLNSDQHDLLGMFR